jgi:ubiquinol-cytochrome c reductase cytochrome c1 subunit
MKKLFFGWCLLLFTHTVWALPPTISLERAPIDLSDKKSIARGAKFFATTCMSCHTLIYLRYDKLAADAGITYAKMPIGVKWPQGAVPPDLSLEASARGVDWIYTYLHSFYLDPARPTGVNNLLVPNTMMPGIITVYQGRQILAGDTSQSKTLNHEWQWYDLLILENKGSLDPQQFDATITDVVNFLAYASEPFHADQRRLGWKVLVFLAIFFVFAYLLKKEYWKDVK